jgi:pimeloyl-ACP methyl ester carboxylesterase
MRMAEFPDEGWKVTGSYDYSCTPAMTEAIAKEIPGCRYRQMKNIGHFQMIENYELFRTYLLPEIEIMAAE